MQSFQNPWVSLGDGSIFYSNEVTLGDLETSEWVLKSFREDQSLTGNVELSVPLPIFSGGQGWRGGDWVNDLSCLCDEVSRKSPKLWGSESFQIGDHIHVSGVAHLNSTPTLHSGLFWVFFTWLHKRNSRMKLQGCYNCDNKQSIMLWILSVNG